MENELIQSQSPYLLQHAQNPVWWKIWRDEVIQKAQQSNKLLIVSIGYSACHWCHVMEHECFEDHDVAALMNRHFISIKVDREERPDLDQIYMDACQIVSGRGGWPLNAICLPDGRPVFAGTYFPKQNWMQVLTLIQHEFETQPHKLEERAEYIVKGIRQMDNIGNILHTIRCTDEDIQSILNKALSNIDEESGGLKGAPKFPMPVVFKNLLQFYLRTGNSKLFESAENLIYHASMRGCYDHIEGGYMRYAVDAQWEIPHFEKMLYDNAQLLELIALLHLVLPQTTYKHLVSQTTQFICQDWLSPDGGIYSAYDADSEGHEGHYYVYSKEELEQIDQSLSGLLRKHFYIPTEPNFEGNYHLLRSASWEDLQHNESQTIEQSILEYNSVLEELLPIRKTKVKPGLDNKIITSWNALMIKAWVTCYQSFQDKKYLELAKNTAAFIRHNRMNADGSINRTSYQKGFLDDYVFVMDAFLALYKQTADESFLTHVRTLESHIDAHFKSDQNELYYYTSNLEPALIVRKKEIYDQVIPASNSILARLKMEIGLIYGEPDKIESSHLMGTQLKETVLKYPLHFAEWWNVLFLSMHEPIQLIICGEDALEWVQELNRHYWPDVLLLPCTKNSSIAPFSNKFIPNKTVAYCCKDHACSSPLYSIQATEQQIADML